MNRKTTNLLRFFLDECIPPLMRDNRFFMLPLFYLWYKGKNVTRLMEFKKTFHTLSKQDYLKYYQIYDSLPARETDLNTSTLKYIVSALKSFSELNIIDVGCGNGYLLTKLHNSGFKKLTGCDINPPETSDGIKYVNAEAENLPFHDLEFDITVCNHTLEHVIDIQKAVLELKRITRKFIVVTIPCQRYYHYTFDLHVHFFPEESYVHNLMRIPNGKCEKIDGDWCYIGSLEPGNDQEPAIPGIRYGSVQQ